MSKITNEPLTWDILTTRYEMAKRRGFVQKAKWIIFSETLLAKGFTLQMYEAKLTVSKYIVVTRPGSDKKFKVRFSDHMPAEGRIKRSDCDLFVGKSQFGWINTQQALKVVLNHFK
jgi:hypothetical protein